MGKLMDKILGKDEEETVSEAVESDVSENTEVSASVETEEKTEKPKSKKKPAKKKPAKKKSNKALDAVVGEGTKVARLAGKADTPTLLKQIMIATGVGGKTWRQAVEEYKLEKIIDGAKRLDIEQCKKIAEKLLK